MGAELTYWQWKHGGLNEADATLAALINRKFAHVVRHIMPHAGWTADVEYERILEMETASLSSSEFSDGLAVKQSVTVNSKGSKSKSKASDGYPSEVVDGGDEKDATGSAVSSTAPAAAISA